MVQLYILRLDEIGSPSYFTLLLPHFKTCSAEHSVLITCLLLTLFDNYFLLMLLLRLLLFEKTFQTEGFLVTAYLTYQNIFIGDHMHFLLILFCIYLDNEQ